MLVFLGRSQDVVSFRSLAYRISFCGSNDQVVSLNPIPMAHGILRIDASATSPPSRSIHNWKFSQPPRRVVRMTFTLLSLYKAQYISWLSRHRRVEVSEPNR
jgi:hypothetical protein